jgi:gliding motility-associated lipoprotein GldH
MMISLYRTLVNKEYNIPASHRLMLLFVPFGLFFLSACNSGVIFDNNKSISGDVWKSDQIIRFDVPVEDTVHIFKFYLNLRNTTSYRYANIFLFIDSTFPDGKQARDTVECILADPSGKWLGKGISNIRDNQVLLRRGLRFPQKGNYIFEFQQAMREHELKGIMDIGLRIVRE